MSQEFGSVTSMEEEPVEIWFKLVKSADGYPESQDWEELWARPAGDGYRIESTPFFENRVSKGDLVVATLQGDGFLQFERVVERGRHSTFRVLIDDERVSVESVTKDLKSLGAECEVTLDNLVAIDVSEEAMKAVEDFLVRGRDNGRWGLQDGFIFQPPNGAGVVQ
jgi:hypothetical protein